MDLIGTVTGEDVIVRRLAYPHLLGQPSRAFTTKAGEIGRDAVRDEAPEGITKKLKGSIDFAVDPGSPSLWMRVFSDLDYAKDVEGGTRPHTPPIAAITPWALAKGIPPGALWHRIRVFGTMPNPFFKRGIAHATPRIRALLTVLARGIERAGSSG